MAIKAKLSRVLKAAEQLKFPSAFWFGFWFVLGGYWGIVVIGAMSDLTRLAFGLVLS